MRFSVLLLRVLFLPPLPSSPSLRCVHHLLFFVYLLFRSGCVKKHFALKLQLQHLRLTAKVKYLLFFTILCTPTNPAICSIFSNTYTHTYKKIFGFHFTYSISFSVRCTNKSHCTSFFFLILYSSLRPRTAFIFFSFHNFLYFFFSGLHDFNYYYCC